MLRKSSRRGFVLLTSVAAILATKTSYGQSSFKLTGALLDSEHATFWKSLPSGELTFRQPTQNNWSASVQLRLLPLKPNDPNNTFEVRLKEGFIAYDSSEGRSSVGRIPVRPESLGLNESTRSFLRSEPFVDGFRFETQVAGLRTGLLVGGPQVAALSLSKRFSNLHASLLYRGQRHRISEQTLTDTEGETFKLMRAAHSHEAEINLRQSTELLQAEGLLQIHQQGAQRRVDASDEQFSRVEIGSIDVDLPKAQLDYRSAVQLKVLIGKGELNSDWLIFAFASRNAVRFYSGTEEFIARNQGGKGSSMLTLGLETKTPRLSAQAGLSAEVGSKKQFAYFANKSPQGHAVLVRSKLTFWYAAQLAL